MFEFEIWIHTLLGALETSIRYCYNALEKKFPNFAPADKGGPPAEHLKEMPNYELFTHNASLTFEVECELKMKIDKKVYNWSISSFLNIDCFLWHAVAVD